MFGARAAMAAWLGVALAQAQTQNGREAAVILISIDTLRADHLGAYGYRKISTSNLDSFAEQGTIFSDVSSQIPLTLPSHTSLFTSTYPFKNEVEENAEIVPAGAVTLSSVLRSHGYQTAAFIGSNLLDRRFGLDQGFDFYDSPFEAPTNGLANPYSASVRRDGALVLRAARSWLNTHSGKPALVFIHLFDLHAPYKLAPRKGSSEPETAGYDAEIGYVDRILGDFKRFLAQSGWWDKSLVVLLSDHGESLGEHGETSHGYFIYQSTLHVPLIVHWPAGEPKHPERVSQPAGLIDVAPTILDWLHIPIPASFEGESLVSSSAHEPHAIASESVYARDAFRWAPLFSLRLGQWKYIEAPRSELYDVAKDPREQSNILAANSAEAASLRGELSRLRARYQQSQAAPAQDTSHGTREALKSLGYLAGGGPKAVNRSAPDPKDRIEEYQLFDRALDALYSRRLEAAIHGFQQVLAKDRNNLPALGNLGDAYLRAGQPDAAVREWTAALALDSGYSPAAQALGEHGLAEKNWAKAQQYLDQALAAAPGDHTVEFELAIAEENLGMFDKALEHVKAACGPNPPSSCQNELREIEAKRKAAP